MSSFSGIFGDFRPGLPVFSASLPSTLPLFQKAREYTGTKQEDCLFANWQKVTSSFSSYTLTSLITEILAANGATTPSTLTHRSTNTRTTQPL